MTANLTPLLTMMVEAPHAFPMETTPPFLPADPADGAPDAYAARAWLRTACELLGGQVATAQLLNMSDRNMRRLIAGQRDIPAGILAEVAGLLASTARAMLDHATTRP